MPTAMPCGSNNLKTVLEIKRKVLSTVFNFGRHLSLILDTAAVLPFSLKIFYSTLKP